jgi:hypothetical protein
MKNQNKKHKKQKQDNTEQIPNSHTVSHQNTHQTKSLKTTTTNLFETALVSPPPSPPPHSAHPKKVAMGHHGRQELVGKEGAPPIDDDEGIL